MENARYRIYSNGIYLKTIQVPEDYGTTLEAQKEIKALSEDKLAIDVISFFPDEEFLIVSRWERGIRIELNPIWNEKQKGEMLYD